MVSGIHLKPEMVIHDDDFRRGQGTESLPTHLWRDLVNGIPSEWSSPVVWMNLNIYIYIKYIYIYAQNGKWCYNIEIINIDFTEKNLTVVESWSTRSQAQADLLIVGLAKHDRTTKERNLNGARLSNFWTPGRRSTLAVWRSSTHTHIYIYLFICLFIYLYN